MGLVTAATNPYQPAGSQVGAGDPNGEFLGASPATPLGFFGGVGAVAGTPTTQPVAGTAIVQPPSQGANRGVTGTVTAYAVTVTPVSVAPNTTAEQTFTVTGVAAGQIVSVVKPTTQAGLGIVGMRVSATNTVGITFANDSAASITPTATETYVFDVIPAPMTISATLSPQAVGPNTFSEQQFTVNGIAAPSALLVNKPTAQAGLGIVDARVVSAGVVGITFGNFTAATITPTASESYLFFGAPEIEIAPIFKSITASLTPVSVAANTSAEQTFTVPGLNASSQVFINPPNPTAGLGIGNARVSALNTLAVNFINNTAAAIVPPAGVYTLGYFPGAAPAAGSSTAYNGQSGGAYTTANALVALGLIGGP